MTVAEFLARAKSAMGKRTVYKLGAGGMLPDRPTPGNHENACDCSGFVCWALGRSRYTSERVYQRLNGGWINTDAMIHDANTANAVFRRIAAPRVGAIVVYGARKPVRTVGHVGIVTALDAHGATATVLHCSSGNWKRHGDAIRETDPAVFRAPDTIYAWPVALTES